MKTLLLDAHSICYRAKYSPLVGLRVGNQFTGIMYGFFRELHVLLKLFTPDRIVFTWDSKGSLRKKLFPTYKENRYTRIQTAEEIAFDEACSKQFVMLRDEVIPRIGFNNNYKFEGYEADDLIASIVQNNLGDFVIASSDMDLYQLLSDRISMYLLSTKKRYTERHFIDEYEILPKQWVRVKSLAGCSSDNVGGIPHVGNKTACKFLTNRLNTESKAYHAIISNRGKSIARRNYDLVCLPFKGTPVIKLGTDALSISELKLVFLDYNFRSLLKPDVFNEIQRLLRGGSYYGEKQSGCGKSVKT